MIKSKDFTHFLSVFESGEMGLEIGDIHLYYSSGESQLQVIREFRVCQFYAQHYDDSMSVITMDIEINDTDIKEVLRTFLKEFITSPYVHNYPHYLQSSLFSSEEYGIIREAALRDRREKG